jgi:hypothetical protein
VGEAELSQHLLDALVHQVLWPALVLHGKGQFVLNSVHHKLRFRVLLYETDDRAHGMRAFQDRVAAAHADLTGKAPAAEMGYQSIQRAQQRRFARAGWPGEQDKLTSGDA